MHFRAQIIYNGGMTAMREEYEFMAANPKEALAKITKEARESRWTINKLERFIPMETPEME